VSGSGIECGTVCSTTLDAGTPVTLKAAAAAGSIFTGWSGACTGTRACKTKMNSSKSVTANFAVKRKLTISRTGLGTVTSNPMGISCGTSCAKGYPAGTSVMLTATPAPGQAFLGWSGACTGTALQCTVTLTSNRKVGAAFN
jgi:hypothetical protein